jgi:hypothetical protein
VIDFLKKFILFLEIWREILYIPEKKRPIDEKENRYYPG